MVSTSTTGGNVRSDGTRATYTTIQTSPVVQQRERLRRSPAIDGSCVPLIGGSVLPLVHTGATSPGLLSLSS